MNKIRIYQRLDKAGKILATWTQRTTEAGPIIADYLVHGSVSAEIFTARLAICRECPERIVDGEKEYCGACKCPKWVGSELKNKLQMGRLSCPLKKFEKV